MTNRNYIFLIAAACLMLGFASAKIYEAFYPRSVNIFERTRKEAGNIRWVRDSSLRVYPFRIEGELTFAGERVPLEDIEVRERLDRELQINIFRQSNTLLNMKLANRYFDVVEKILQEEGLPGDFKYLPLIESDFREVVSPAGAAGYWQFLNSTGKAFGLEINDAIDERYHMEKATRAACSYLKLAKEKLGSWTAAAASYNYGIEGILSRMQSQHVSNYYDLAITSETSRYVFRMLAMKVIFMNPEKAGYIINEEDLYQPYSFYTLLIDTTINDLPTFAESQGIKYKELKMLNPWLRSGTLPNRSRKTYELKILKK